MRCRIARFTRLVFSPCVILFFLLVPAAAVSRDLPDPDAVFDFAASSFDEGDYSTAIVEFKRFLFFFPDDPRAAEAAFNIGMARFRESSYPKAVEAFESVMREYPGTRYATDARFMLGRSYLELNDPETALAVLSPLTALGGDRFVRDRALHQIGWIQLQNRNLPAARAAFSAISEANRDHFRVGDILARLDEPGKLPRKSPWLAGIFSIIPGGGYLYNGLYREAGIAFFINAGLAAAAYESFDNDLYVLGGMISLVNLGFYSGSIYGGISSAHKHNERVYDAFVEDLRMAVSPNLSLRFQPKTGSVFLSVDLPF